MATRIAAARDGDGIVAGVCLDLIVEAVGSGVGNDGRQGRDLVGGGTSLEREHLDATHRGAPDKESCTPVLLRSMLMAWADVAKDLSGLQRMTASAPPSTISMALPVLMWSLPPALDTMSSHVPGCGCRHRGWRS